MVAKIKFKPLIFWIIGTFVVAGIGALISGEMRSDAQDYTSPSFQPPGIVFGIVWPILYLLMGISAYLVYMSSSKFKKSALTVFVIQLVVNAIWPVLFFRFDLYLFSAIWLLLLLALVVIMFVLFYKVRPLAAWLQIPYVLWLVFAAILNFSVYFLNR